MATATLLPMARAVFFDANGNCVAGGLVHTYIPGGTVAKATWQDAAETILNANPIVLDSAGSCLLYGSGSYQLTVTDALGVAIPAYSGVTSDNAPLATTLVYTPPFTGGVATTVSGKLSQFVTATDFGAVGDGVANDAPAIQAAIDALTATGGTVYLTPGTYRITVALKLRPNVTLTGTRAATIKQGNAANLSSLIDFNTNSAINAGVVGLTLDGNRASNTESSLTYMCASSQAGTRVVNCAINNTPGQGLLLQGVNPVVTDNTFTSTRSIAVDLFGLVAGFASGGKVLDNTFTYCGQACIATGFSDYNIITGNRISGPCVTSQVSTVGTAVTWVSGGTFATLLGGMFIRIGGTEYQIQSVNSTTSLTLTTSAGTLTNQPAVSGTGDNIGITSSSFTVVSNNVITGGMSAGVMLSNYLGVGEGPVQTVISNNVITGCGNCGIGVLGDGSTAAVDTTVISGNTITGCGIGGTANVANSNNGIWITGAHVGNTVVTGNYCRDFGTGAQKYSIYVDASVPAGQVFAHGNHGLGSVGDTFGVGWQTYTPTLSPSTGAFTLATATGRYRLNDKTVEFSASVVITTNGTAAGPILVGLPVIPGGGYCAIAGFGRVLSGKALAGTVVSGQSAVGVINADASYAGGPGENLIVTGTYEAA